MARAYKVHPAADCFPMLSGEELAAVAADIKANGVRVPIAFWGKYDGKGRFHGELIDGRNRLEAAECAGLDLNDIPQCHLNYGDPVIWVLSLNVHRRHLTSKQQADSLSRRSRPGRNHLNLSQFPKAGAARSMR